jgi:hypothetical protein
MVLLMPAPLAPPLMLELELAEPVEVAGVEPEAARAGAAASKAAATASENEWRIKSPLG